MTVTLEVPHALCRFTGEKTSVELDGSTVGEVLAALWNRYPQLESRMLDRSGRLYPYLLLLRNDQKLPRDEMLATPLQSGDRLEIVALAEGG